MEDFGVFLSMVAAGMQLRTLPQTLVRYRLHPTQISAVHRAHLPAAALAVRAEVNAKAVTLRFANIYRTKWWGDGCPSGDGSEADHTAPLVAPIADLLAGYGVASVLDIGCGWSPWLEAALGTARYLGIDAVQSVIDKRRRRAAVGCTFVLHDLTTEPMADAFDIAVARDVMGHLPDAVVLEMLRNVTSSTYMLLATHWPDAGVVPDIAVGMWRRIDLCRAPFNLPPPVESIAEVDAGKTLALFDLSDWPA
jgi:SAM-dependent methyltransferase